MAREVVTDRNLAPVIEVFIWLTLVFSLLTVIARLSVKMRVVRKTGIDDIAITTSLLFAGGQSIAMSIATANGLGVSTQDITDSELSAELKASYAATMLFILSCYFAKISFVLFIRALTATAKYRQLGKYLGFVITLWALSALLTAAFQCQLPRPWDTVASHCFNIVAWESYVAIGNAVTDVALIALPFAIVASVQIATKRKVAVLFAFSLRLSAIAAIVCQAVFANLPQTSENRGPGAAPFAISTQFAQCFSICSACALYLKTLLDSLESGFIHIGDLRRQHSEGFGYIHKGSELLNPLRSITSRLRKDRVQDSTLQGTRLSTIGELPRNEAQVEAEQPQSANFDDRETNSRSEILHTRGWTVEYGGNIHAA